MSRPQISFYLNSKRERAAYEREQKTRRQAEDKAAVAARKAAAEVEKARPKLTRDDVLEALYVTVRDRKRVVIRVNRTTVTVAGTFSDERVPFDKIQGVYR